MAVSSLATPSATLAALKRHGLYTKKSLGQHFLVDDNVLARMLDLAALAGDETVLEVGPGIGTLTVALCERAHAVVAVERDGELVEVLVETTGDCPRFSLIMADAVDVSADAVSGPFGPPTAMVANLPYGVAATVVLRFLRMIPSLGQVTVMVQSEVADRMAAVPGTKAYGAYTVKLRLVARPVGRFNVAPGCFLPPPRVDSAVIRLERHQPDASPELVRWAAAVADAAFAQRRKTLRNSLRAASGLSADDIDRALLAAGIDGGVRAEALEPDSFIEIARHLGAGISSAHRL
jgi:16S rRNA (adenine1518-N6/adenine1519-N6)-dimethyltransferase